LNRAPFTDFAYLTTAISTGLDLFGRTDMHWSLCPLDDRFPRALREFPDRFSHLICDAMFHEEWYPDDQILRLVATFQRVRPLHGAIVEIGCWEGRSTIALANACCPEPLLAVDTWLGQLAEHPNHITVQLAKERDVFAQFQKNLRLLTAGNVVVNHCDYSEFFLGWNSPLKFVHIDGSHDYESVKRTIQYCLQWIVPGGVICGGDFQTACLTRADLGGGVERAVRELLPGFEQLHNFWLWSRGSG
jgi:hypothetical protein